MSIFVGEGSDDYSAMQGPAPDGFHVPLTTEWQAVYDIRTALGGGSSDGTNFGIALKLPFAGYRGSSSTSVNGQGSYGHYWSSSRRNTNYANNLYFYSTALYPQNGEYPVLGFSVRCFKNSPTVPTSYWTKLYGTSIESGGIFWSSVDGLISLSSDGQTWITISDKNLGATQVWNSGDTLSEANCGKYYQWGNNYGFPFTGSVTTSSTQVDASNYGPGNYYNSNTFITRSSAPYSWDSTDNGNLRGGETGITKKPNIKDIFIGEGADDYSAMQGPAPDGFHVPLQAERQSLKSMLNSLGLSYETYRQYLKIPKAGCINFQNSKVNVGSSAYLRTCSRGGDNWAYIMTPDNPSTYRYCAGGYNIRPFKNKPISPNGRSTIYQGQGNSGIFRNSSAGLISISSNGTTRITIADKNLGATVVYNEGNTLSESNCGKYYQWGNNYGFPFSSSYSVSTTTVNASSYGPGNYYNSSTFIKGSYSRDSTHNYNLRGGETGVVRKGNVKKVYVGDNLVRP